jgi:AmmeMemoRadiSam system protein B
MQSKRVFLLGPAHHEYIDGCSLSKCDVYETPLGDIKLDREG